MADLEPTQCPDFKQMPAQFTISYDDQLLEQANKIQEQEEETKDMLASFESAMLKSDRMRLLSLGVVVRQDCED